jgi:hypothetical protein
MIRTISSSVYLWSSLFFCIDSSLFFLYEQQPVYILLAYIIAILFYRSNRPQLGFMIFLVSLQSFLYFNIFGLSLLYLIPAILITQRLKPMLYTCKIYPLVLALGCLMAQIYGINSGLLGLENPIYYTIFKIFGTLILVGFFSLKIMGYNKTIAYS